MGRKRGRRVEKVKHGYADKKRNVRVRSDAEGLEKVVERRVERGYRKGYKRRHAGEEVGVRRSKKKGGRKKSGGKNRGGRRVELGYTTLGTPVRHERKSRSKPSRPMRVSKMERWGRKGERGTYRRQTTEGRRTAEEARKKELGGMMRVWAH